MIKSFFYRKIYRPVSKEEKAEVIISVTKSASPGFDYFLLVVLSAAIATLGLITNSAAVIIGAMLVAPLMSPLIGIGLATVTGDGKILVSSLSSLLRGSLLAILLAVLLTLLNNRMPFFSIQELPSEILMRTNPSPIDLTIALAGGIAAAYALTQPNISAAVPGVAIATALMPPLCTVGIGIALGRWDVAGGALLLFITNAVTIAFSAMLVFYTRGFSSDFRFKGNKVPLGLMISSLLTVILLIPLSYYSVKFFQEARDNREINRVVQDVVQEIPGAKLVGLEVTHLSGDLDLLLNLQTRSSLRYEQVVGLQETIVKLLNRPLTLKVNQVLAEQLDPLIPPTVTNTPTATFTPTPGPSPTATVTPTATPTASPSPTASPTATETPLPTSTPTITFTPASYLLGGTPVPALRLSDAVWWCGCCMAGWRLAG